MDQTMDAPTITPCGSEDYETPVDVSINDLEDMTSPIELLQALMSAQEKGYPVCEDYLIKMGESDVDPGDRVSEAWRRKLAEWSYEVVDHFNFDREVVSIALSYLDRAVGIRSKAVTDAIPKREFQLLAVTCLYLAIKVHGESDDPNGPRRKLKIDAFVELSRGFFPVDVIEATERQILSALEWRVNPPTLLRYISPMTRLLPEWGLYEHPSSYNHVTGGIYDVSRYLSELSVCVSKFAFTLETPVTAFASIICAMDALQATLPVPHDAKVRFLTNIEQATGLTPHMPNVVRACEMLRDLSPAMFDEIPPEFLVDRTTAIVSDEGQQEDREQSPVCVVDQARKRQTSSSGRKRSRRTRS